jgi:hypothetical protein
MSMKMIPGLTMEHFDQHRDGNLRHITNMRHRQKMTKSNYVAATRMLGAGGQYSLFWPKKYTVCVVAILTHLEPSDLPETWHEY